MDLLLVVLNLLLQILNLLLKFSIQPIHLFKQTLFPCRHASVIAGISALSQPIKFCLSVLLQLIDSYGERLVFLLQRMNLIDSGLFLKSLGYGLLAFNRILTRLAGINVDSHCIVSTGLITELGVAIDRAFENICL